MIAKNICRFNLFQFAKKNHLGNGLNRYATSYKLKQRPQHSETDHSLNFKKKSASSRIKKELQRYKSAGRQNEHFLATENMRKCNEILKEHFLEKRKMIRLLFKEAMEEEPKITTKLKDIMAKDIANAVTTQPETPKYNSRKIIGIDWKPSEVAYKTRTPSVVTRWRMKVPLSRQRLQDEKNHSRNIGTSSQSASDPKVGNVKKIVRNQAYQSVISTGTEHSDKKNPYQQKIWCIGERIIPQLN